MQNSPSEDHNKKLNNESDSFIGPIVITVEKSEPKKLALYAKPINRQFLKYNYQMLNVGEFINRVSHIVTEEKTGTFC